MVTTRVLILALLFSLALSQRRGGRPPVEVYKAYTDKKRKSNFPHIQGNSGWSSFKAIYEEGLPKYMRKRANIYSYMRRTLVIYDYATAPF
jgi:hypothetical protein